MPDHTPLDPVEARQRQEEGITAADRGASIAFKDAAQLAIMQAALAHETFIVDQVWQYMPARPLEGRAMGAAMRQAAREGMIQATGEWSSSDQPQCHRNPRQVWRSLLR